MIRPVVYKAMVDAWRGVIDHKEMLRIMGEGKPAQAYMHILIMANLPYFGDLSSRLGNA